MKKHEIDAFFEEKRGAFLEDLKTLVAVESVKGPAAPGMPYGPGCAQVLEAAAEIARRMGFSVRNFDNRVITAELGTGAPEVGILGHLDVVPAGEGWHYPPFSATLSEGRLYGRGTADDKGACVAALYAMQAAAALGARRNCRLIMGADEECGCSDLAYYKTQENMPPCVFSPDGDFPVYNTEKGQFSPSFSAKWKKLESGPRLLEFHSGSAAANVVPDSALALIAGLEQAQIQEKIPDFEQETGLKLSLSQRDKGIELRSFGRSAHASKPWEGKNAMTGMLAFLARLPLEGEGAEKLRALSQLFPYGDDFGQALGIAESDEISGPLTVNFSILDADAQGFSGRIDARTCLCTDLEALTEKVKAALEAKAIAMDSCPCNPAHHTPEDSAFVQCLLRSYAAYTGKQGSCHSMGGCTYAHGIPGAVSFGPTFPGVETNLHGVDEYVVLDDLFQAAKIYTQVILELCTL